MAKNNSLKASLSVDEEKKKELFLDNLDDRLFVIVTKDQLDETETAFVNLPITVHGFIKVVGPSYERSFASYLYLSDDAWNEIGLLSEKAKRLVFPREKWT